MRVSPATRAIVWPPPNGAWRKRCAGCNGRGNHRDQIHCAAVVVRSGPKHAECGTVAGPQQWALIIAALVMLRDQNKQRDSDKLDIADCHLGQTQAKA
jgi:hypothetical protein